MSKTIRQKGIIDTKLIAREKDWDSFAGRYTTDLYEQHKAESSRK